MTDILTLLEKAAASVPPTGETSKDNKHLLTSFLDECTPERIQQLITCVREADKLWTNRSRAYMDARAKLNGTFNQHERLREAKNNFGLGEWLRKACATDIETLIYEYDTALARIAELETALADITKVPAMPFPDPGAHSWEAFGRRTFAAWCDVNRLARLALASAEQKS